jgi:hypothetical protein
MPGWGRLGGRRMHALTSSAGASARNGSADGGVARTRLGYDVLVKLEVDELLERECMKIDGV